MSVGMCLNFYSPIRDVHGGAAAPHPWWRSRQLPRKENYKNSWIYTKFSFLRTLRCKTWWISSFRGHSFSLNQSQTKKSRDFQSHRRGAAAADVQPRWTSLSPITHPSLFIPFLQHLIDKGPICMVIES